MKHNAFYLIFGIATAALSCSCDDFLDRPTEDSYNQDNYYQNDTQCKAGVNYLYNSPWYDYQRGFLKVGEELSGNFIWTTQSPYRSFTVNGSNEDLINLSYSLWAEISHCNAVYDNLAKSKGSENVVKQLQGECLTLKAMAYFNLVRTFGEIPLVHNNTESLNAGDYNTYPKMYKSDVYEYIAYTLETAMELMKGQTAEKGHVDYYAAEGLLAKVYLTKAGVTGSLNQSDLEYAAKYAKDVINNSGRKLESNYEDIFILGNRFTDEGLIVLRWTADGSNWTRQNSYQSDLGLMGMDDMGACWGDWSGFTPDMQEAFGVKLLEQTPNDWIANVDTRLHATMMLPGFVYKQFWQDKGGFDYIKAMYGIALGSDYKLTNDGVQSPTGSNTVKHIYGNTYDHQAGAGSADQRMASSVPTFLLRLSDVYLVYAEAMLGSSRASSTSSEVIDAFMAVRNRAIPSAKRPAQVSWEDIWKERRLEFAMEGDRWFDFVRRSYYDYEGCKAELLEQKRNQFWNLDPLYKGYATAGSWDVAAAGAVYDTDFSKPNVDMLSLKDSETAMYFALPFPTEDVTFNPLLGSDKHAEGDHVDVRTVYAY